MVTIARDITCPKCGCPETYADLGDSLTETYWGCRKCGWRVRVQVFTNLAPAQRAAYMEAVKEGHVYVTARGRLAYTTPGRHQYALPTLQRLRHLGLIEQRPGGEYGAWYLVDTAAAQWQVRDIATDDLVRYVPTEREALRLVEGARHLTYAAPGHVPTPRTAPEKVSVELSREDWKEVLYGFASSPRPLAKGRHAEILTALAAASPKEV